MLMKTTKETKEKLDKINTIKHIKLNYVCNIFLKYGIEIGYTQYNKEKKLDCSAFRIIKTDEVHMFDYVSKNKEDLIYSAAYQAIQLLYGQGIIDNLCVREYTAIIKRFKNTNIIYA